MPSFTIIPSNAVLPGDDVPLRIQAALERVDVRGAVVAGAHVVLARPHELDWGSSRDRFGDLHGFQDVVGLWIRASSKTSAREEHVELNLLGFHPQCLRYRGLIDR